MYMINKDRLRPGDTVWVIHEGCEDSPVMKGEVESVQEDGATVDTELLGAVDAAWGDMFPDEAAARAALAARQADAGMNVRLAFFKESGKYYTEDTAYIPDRTMQVYQIADWLRANVKACKGMHLVAMLGELDHGYPVLIPASERA